MSPRISLKRNVAKQRDVELLKIGIFVNFCSLFDWQIKSLRAPFIQERKRILAAFNQTYETKDVFELIYGLYLAQFECLYKNLLIEIAHKFKCTLG